MLLSIRTIRRGVPALTAVLLLGLLSPAAWAADACTIALPAPRAKAGTIDLAPLPADAQVFRAELVLNPAGGDRPAQPTRVSIEGQDAQPLRFVPPRYVSLDALEAVQAALQAGKPLALRLDVTCNGAKRLEVSYVAAQTPVADLPVVAGLKVTHRAGQSLLTFTEPALEPFPTFQTGKDVRDFQTAFPKKHAGLSFRIWRSAQRITPATIQHARLVGECGFFTAWNSGYHQDDTDRRAARRYHVADGGEEVPWGTGIYAHNPDQPGPAFYAVTVARDGGEDFRTLGAGNTTAEAVDETVGPGVPILQAKEEMQEFTYRRGRMTRWSYVRWEAGAHSSIPSRAIDYQVIVPEDPPPAQLGPEPQARAYHVEPAPVGLHLHCWGGSLNGGYGWWYNAHRGAILIASNQVPYDWWTGYHEALGTCRTWGDGHMQPYTINRLMGFLDWAATQWKIDRTRVFTAGASMGGSGAPMYPIRYADRFAWGIAWVGVHIPAQSPQFASSYRNSYGSEALANTMPDGKTSAWDYFNDVWYLRTHPTAETGLIIASNGKNDGAIGWPQAVAFARALQETRRPHFFNWGCDGHGTRTLIGANFDLDVRTDQSLPAFTRCTLDDDLGTATPRPKAQLDAERAEKERLKAAGQIKEYSLDPFDGVARGQLNAYLWWQTQDIVDTPAAWEMTVILKDSAPQPRCQVDLTPRRLQQFQTPAAARFRYTITDLVTNQELAAGDATADRDGLLTLPRIPLVKGQNRVRITPAR